MRIVLLNQSGTEGVVNCDGIVSIDGEPYVDSEEQFSDKEIIAGIADNLFEIHKKLDQLLGIEPEEDE